MFIRLNKLSLYRIMDYKHCQIWYANRWRDVIGLFPNDQRQYLVYLIEGERIVVPGRAWVWCERR